MASKKKKPESNLVKHAKFEMDFIGLFDPTAEGDVDYNGMISSNVLELIELFASQGHSGASAGLTLDVFMRLANFRPLTPVTNQPSEWEDISADVLSPGQIAVGEKLWQNKRSSSTFSKDGGITWYDRSNNTEGTSVTIEEALNGTNGDDTETKTVSKEQEDQSGPGESQGGDEAKGPEDTDKESAPEPQDSQDPRDGRQPAELGGGEQKLERQERGDRRYREKRRKKEARRREESQDRSKKGGKE